MPGEPARGRWPAWAAWPGWGWSTPCSGAWPDEPGYEQEALKGALERQAEREFPVETQLRYGGGRENDGVRDGAFLI